jgi:hypothetical protein
MKGMLGVVVSILLVVYRCEQERVHVLTNCDMPLTRS